MTFPVIVPLDGSATAERALPVAAGIARRVGAPLHLVRVHPPDWADRPARWPGERREEAWEKAFAGTYLGEVAQRVLADAGMASIVTAVLDGSVERALVAYARGMSGLIVMSTRGRRDDGTSGISGVADRVVRWSGLPVVLVPAGDRSPTPTPADWRCVRILLATDGASGTGPREGLLRTTAALARAFAGHVIVFESGEESAGASGPPVALRSADPPTSREPLLGENVGAWLRSQGASAEVRRTTGARHGEAIVALAEALDVDLIAMSVPQRADSGVLRYASPISGVLRHAAVPVLVWSSRASVPTPLGDGQERRGSAEPLPAA